MDKLVSIGIPAYKEAFLKYALESVLIQSYENLEIIIVNDNPNSNIKKIVNVFKDQRIIYFENEKNIGAQNLIAVWNSLLEKVTGEYFIMFSDDDIMHKDFVLEMLQLAEKNPLVNLYHCRVKVIDEQSNVKYFVGSSPAFETATDFIWHRIKNLRQFFVPDFMVQTEIIRKIGGFANLKNAWAADDLTWFKVANHGGVAATSKILCYWRESDFNISQVGNPISKLSAINDYHQLLLEFLENELIVASDQKEIFADIKKNLRTKIITDFGNALKSSIQKNIFGLIQVSYFWIRYKNKYKIPFEALVWSFLLIIKEMKRK